MLLLNMASYRVAQILRVRSDFTDQQIADMSDAEGWRWIYEQDRLQKAQSGPNRQQICFTGFSLTERAILEAKASEYDLEVKSSVTKALRYLCTGPDAGPSKVAKAREQGVLILSAEQFHLLCETGELPGL